MDRHRNSGETADGFAYFTKRILISRTKAAGKIAAKNAMKTMGYVVVVEGDWVVRKNADGSVHKLKKIRQTNTKRHLLLD